MDESRAEQRRSLTDIRLQEQDFDFDGRKYKLRCNMNILADVQEAGMYDMSQLVNE